MQGIKIAILDDVYSDLVEIQNSLNTVFNDAEVSLFEQGVQLLDAIHKGEIFDLIFLDIY